MARPWSLFISLGLVRDFLDLLDELDIYGQCHNRPRQASAKFILPRKSLHRYQVAATHPLPNRIRPICPIRPSTLSKKYRLTPDRMIGMEVANDEDD